MKLLISWLIRMKFGSEYDLLDTPVIWNTKRFTEVTIYKVFKRSSGSSRKNWFHKVCSINHHLLRAVVRKWLSCKPCQFVQKYFFSIKFLHAYFPYVYNISTQCWKDPLKAELISQSMHYQSLFTRCSWKEKGVVKKSLSKNIFSASNFFMHIFNMSVTYLLSVENIHWKL